jgi:hypothetical protein
MVAVKGPKDRPIEGDDVVPDAGWIQHQPPAFYQAMIRNMHIVPSRHRISVHVRLDADGDMPARLYRIETEDDGYIFQCSNHEPVDDATLDATDLSHFATRRRYSLDEIEGFLTDAISHRH